MRARPGMALDQKAESCADAIQAVLYGKRPALRVGRLARNERDAAERDDRDALCRLLIQARNERRRDPSRSQRFSSRIRTSSGAVENVTMTCSIRFSPTIRSRSQLARGQGGRSRRFREAGPCRGTRPVSARSRDAQRTTSQPGARRCPHRRSASADRRHRFSWRSARNR